MVDKIDNIPAAQNGKNYRPNVAAIVLSAKYPEKCEVFIASRTDVDNAWQFPQGGIDKGETAREALFRELEEETGYRAKKMTALITYYPSIGYNTEVIHCFVASGLKKIADLSATSENLIYSRVNTRKLREIT